jgi:hypothetical protein
MLGDWLNILRSAVSKQHHSNSAGCFLEKVVDQDLGQQMILNHIF